jgi:hypothetical protein
LIRAPAILLLVLASCASHGAAVTNGIASVSGSEIRYASVDLRHLIIFAEDGAHFGPPLEFWPAHPPPPTRYFEPSEGVQCVSIGHDSQNSTDYAIKRPIRAGERYRCLTTAFRVIECFMDCQAAIIEREWRLSNGDGTLKSYMYVDSCLGVLAFSESNDLAESIPRDTAWLRGEVGILADRHYPDCRPF